MKRLVILVMTLCLCFPTFATAESLFPSLSTPEPAAVTGEKAPSYGGMANVDPDDVQSYAEGGQVVTYENVDEQGYQNFGVYLNKLGYEVVAQNVRGRTAEMKLSDGKFNIGMVYDGEAQKMQLIYEEGVEYEKRDVLKAYFPDATTVELGEEIEIRGLGKYSFTKYNMGGEIIATYLQGGGYVIEYTYSSNTWIELDFYNTKTETCTFCYPYNAPISLELVYINDENTYSFEVNSRVANKGRYNESIWYAMGAVSREDVQNKTIGRLTKIPSMEEEHLAVAFDLPNGVINSVDGYLALCITCNTDEQEKYILILREDGKKIGEW